MTKKQTQTNRLRAMRTLLESPPQSITVEAATLLLADYVQHSYAVGADARHMAMAIMGAIKSAEVKS